MFQAQSAVRFEGILLRSGKCMVRPVTGNGTYGPEAIDQANSARRWSGSTQCIR